MTEEKNLKNKQGSISIGTTCSGTSSFDESSSPVTTLTTPSGTDSTATIDYSVVGDSEPVPEPSSSEPSKTGRAVKEIRFLDWVARAGILFQIIFWGGLLLVAYNSSVYGFAIHFSSLFAGIRALDDQTQASILSIVILGVVSSVLATVIVLITRVGFYRVRDRLTSRSLFRGIAGVSDPCLIFTLRMKDSLKRGEFINPIPPYSAVNPASSQGQINKFEKRMNIPWLTSTSEAQSLALIFNVLGRIGRTENIEVAFADKEYERWDAPMFSLGGNWKTQRAFKTCNPHFEFREKENAFIIPSTEEVFRPVFKDEDLGLLQKMTNSSNGLPIWILMGYRGGGTVAAAYALVRWWKCLGALYGANNFGLLVGFDDKDGWQHSRIIRIYPKPKWHRILRHPFAWRKLSKRML